MGKNKRTTSATKQTGDENSHEAETSEADRMDYKPTHTTKSNMASTRSTRRGIKHDEHNSLTNAQKSMEKVIIEAEEQVYEGLAKYDKNIDRIRSQMAQYLAESRDQTTRCEMLNAGHETIRKGLSYFTIQLSEGVAALQRSDKTLKDIEAAAVLRDQKIDELRNDLKIVQAKIDAEIEVTTEEDEPAPEPIKPVKTPKPKAKKDTKKVSEVPEVPEKVEEGPKTAIRPTRAERAEKRAAQSNT